MLKGVRALDEARQGANFKGSYYIYTNHPGRNLVNKHENIKFDIVGV